MRDLQEAARAKEVQLLILKAGTEREIDSALASFVQLHASALLVGNDPFFFSRREQLVALARLRGLEPFFIACPLWTNGLG
jgi:putative ABC transport system substrate-binding protein